MWPSFSATRSGLTLYRTMTFLIFVLLSRSATDGLSVLEPVPGPEDPDHHRQTDNEEQQRCAEAHPYSDIRGPVEAPAKAADQVHHGVEQAERAPGGREHVDRVERAAEKRERRDHEHRHELKLLEAVRPDAEDEAEQAEGRRGQHHESDHRQRVRYGDRHEQVGGREDHEAKHDRLRRRGTDVGEHHLERRDRRREHLVDRTGEARQIDAERGVRQALGEARRHDKPGPSEGHIVNDVSSAHARADGCAEHHEVEGRRDHRRGQALPHRAPEARHLEAIDRRYSVWIEPHARSLTRLTKMSSSELCPVLRSLKPMPSSPRRPSSAGMPACSSAASYVYSSWVPPALSASCQSASPAGIAAIGASSCTVRCFLPSFFISVAFSSTTISSPLWTTPIRSAISSASSM